PDGRIRACLPGPLPIVSGGVRPAFPDAGALRGEKRQARRLGEEGRRWAGVERSRPSAWKRAAEEATQPVADARTAPLWAMAERVPRPGRNRKYPVGSPAGQAVGIGEMGSQDRGRSRVAIHPPPPLAAQEWFLTPFSPHHIGLAGMVPWVEQVIVNADGEQHIPMFAVFLLQGALDFANHGHAFDRLPGADHHQLVIMPDGGFN